MSCHEKATTVFEKPTFLNTQSDADVTSVLQVSFGGEAAVVISCKDALQRCKSPLMELVVKIGHPFVAFLQQSQPNIFTTLLLLE